MPNDDHAEKPEDTQSQGFLSMLLRGLIRDTLGMWIVVLIGIVAGAVICVSIGAPLSWSLLGGVVVLAIYVAWDRL